MFIKRSLLAASTWEPVQGSPWGLTGQKGVREGGAGADQALTPWDYKGISEQK